MRKAHETLYGIQFSPKQWDELFYLTFEPFEFSPGEDLTRGQWLALADMALGKARRIEERTFLFAENCSQGVDIQEQASELRTIAAVILEFFRGASSIQ